MSEKKVKEPTIANCKRMKLFFPNGATNEFRYVTILRDDQDFLKFTYISIVDDRPYEGLFYKRFLAGVATYATEETAPEGNIDAVGGAVR